MALSDATVARVRHAVVQRPSRRTVAFAALLLVYLLVTLGVIYRSPLLTLDTDLFKLDLQRRWPDLRPWVKVYVMLGQRGPATLIFLPWFCWVSWRNRTIQPLLTLAVGLVLLNLSVGVVKLATGRLGPSQTSNTHRIFDGGSIYPSGHVSNAVVLYGLIAMIAINHRRAAAAAAAFLSVTVGLGTVYRDTHWFSDVLGGWVAGGLVLIVIPWVMPTAERIWNGMCRRLAGRLPWVTTLYARPLGWATPTPAAVRPPVRVSAGRPTSRSESLPATAKVGPRHVVAARSTAPVAVTAVLEAPAQPIETPVSSVAAAHKLSPARASFEARDESTRRGKPRTSPIPSGP